jgi:hypothetical protein
VVRGFSRRFYDVLSGASGDTGAIELSADELEAVEEDDDVFEPDDDEIVTHTNIPVLQVPKSSAKASAKTLNDGESTSPTPKSTLPRGRG